MPHIHEKIDFCSETFVVFENKVLLRKHDKMKIWLSVGGHIELHEDPCQAAIREVWEEVGLNVTLYQEPDKQPEFPNSKLKSLIVPQYANRHPITDTHEHIAFVFFATTKNDVLKLSETEVAEDCRWFTREELIKNEFNIPETTQFYALKALEKLKTN